MAPVTLPNIPRTVPVTHGQRPRTAPFCGAAASVWPRRRAFSVRQTRRPLLHPKPFMNLLPPQITHRCCGATEKLATAGVRAPDARTRRWGRQLRPNHLTPAGEAIAATGRSPAGVSARHRAQPGGLCCQGIADSSANDPRHSPPQRPPRCGGPNERIPPRRAWVGTRLRGTLKPSGFFRGPKRLGPAQHSRVGRRLGGPRKTAAATGLDGGPSPKMTGGGCQGGHARP